MLVACLGDVLLDVIVEVDGAMRPDDDTPAAVTLAAGGQAANVATWVVALGGRARVFGPRAADPGRIVATAAAARERGSRVAVDLSSASMVSAHGADDFAVLCRALRPSVVLGTDAELATSRSWADPGAVLVAQHGRSGATFHVGGIPDQRSSRGGPVVDVTGAGDALAAGYLVGGADLAMQAARRCVAARGAQPAGVA